MTPSKEAVFYNSIYSNYDNYKKMIASLTGVDNYAFTEDIISDCVMNITVRIKTNKLLLEDITYGETDTINHSYFKKLIINRCKDILRSKRANQLSAEHIPDAEDEIEPEKVDHYDEVNHILTQLEQFAAKCPHDNFHSSVFKYIYLEGYKGIELSRKTNIPRYVITNSKKITLAESKEWLTKARDKMAVKKARAIIGINGDGEQLPFASAKIAAASGYPSVRDKIGKAVTYKGYEWSYVDSITIMETSVDPCALANEELQAKGINATVNAEIYGRLMEIENLPRTLDKGWLNRMNKLNFDLLRQMHNESTIKQISCPRTYNVIKEQLIASLQPILNICRKHDPTIE